MSVSIKFLLKEMHDESEGQSFARARSQFQGADEEFAQLLNEYLGMSPRKKGDFLKKHGFSTADAHSSQGTLMSLAISPDMGKFLYNLTLAQRPKRVLELGSSYGVSALYFASALREIGTGQLIATELDIQKCEKLKQNLKMVGVDSYVSVLEGDIFKNFDKFDGHFDIVFMDVWSTLYLELFQRLEPFLRSGSVVITDNMYTSPEEVYEFKKYLDENPRLSSTTLNFESGVEFTVII